MSNEVAGNEVREVSMRILRIICRLDFISKVMGAMEEFFKQKNEINRFVGIKHYSTSKMLNRLDINKLFS